MRTFICFSANYHDNGVCPFIRAHIGRYYGPALLLKIISLLAYPLTLQHGVVIFASPLALIPIIFNIVPL